jgi:hypothetical protein
MLLFNKNVLSLFWELWAWLPNKSFFGTAVAKTHKSRWLRGGGASAAGTAQHMCYQRMLGNSGVLCILQARWLMCTIYWLVYLAPMVISNDKFVSW